MNVDLDDALSDSTLKLTCSGEVGTGFLVAPKLALTCGHVVRESSSHEVIAYWHKQNLTARVLGNPSTLASKGPDLALLSLESLPADHPYCPLEEAYPEIGDSLHTFGYTKSHPDGDSASFTYEGTTIDPHDGKLLKFQMGEAYEGMSGAPLVRLRTGGVCGIVATKRPSSPTGGGRALPVATACDLWPQELRNIPLSEAWLKLLPGLRGVHAYLSRLRERAGAIEVLGMDIVADALPLKEILIERGSASEQQVVPEPAPSVLLRCSRLAILGEPGQGKTTLLRQYAYAMAQNPDTAKTPLLVEFRLHRHTIEGAEKDFNWLHQRVPYSLTHALGEKGWERICTLIERGEASILLDGLDELASDARSQVRGLIGLFTGKPLEDNQIVLTSRPDAYLAAPLRYFESYRLRELQPTTIKTLATNVCQAIGNQRGVNHEPGLQRVLEASEGPAAKLAGNSLFLSSMCLVGVTGKVDEFPSRPVPLIRQCVNELVKWHQKEKDWSQNVLASDIVKTLGPLAYEALKDPKVQITEDQVAKKLKGSAVSLADLLSGRFLEKRNGDYAFPLETFRDYFAAQYLAGSSDPFARVRRHLHTERWQTVVLYTAGSLESLPTSLKTRQSIESFVTRILRHGCPYERILGRDLRLAARCLGVSDAKKVARRITDLLIAKASKDDSWTDRVTALHDAARCVAVSNRLLELTGAPDAAVRRTAAMALGASASEPPIWQRLLKLTEDPELTVRQAGAVALWGAASEPEVCRRLVELARVSPEIDLILCSLAGTGLVMRLSEPRVLNQVLELTRDNAPTIRSSAASRLKDMAGRTEVRKCLLGLTRDHDPTVRVEAVRSLEGFASQPEVRTRMVELRSDSDAGVQLAAFIALVSEPEVWKHLLELTYHADPNTRGWATKALEKVSCEPPVCRRLVDLSQDADETVRAAAEGTLGQRASDPAVRKLLLELTRDPNAEVRAVAVWSVAGGRFMAGIRSNWAASEPEIWKRLVELTSDGSQRVRHASVVALSAGSSVSEVSKRLLDLTLDADLRRTAVRSLKWAASEGEVRKRLLELTWETDADLREAAVWSLEGAARLPEVWKRLLELTSDASLDVRERAVWSLKGAAWIPEVWKRLLEVTGDASLDISKAAVRSLEGVTQGVTKILLQRIGELAEKNEEFEQTLGVLMRAWEDQKD